MNGLHHTRVYPTLNGLSKNSASDETPAFGAWTFEQDTDGNLDLKKNGSVLFRFIEHPYNLFARTSSLTVHSNGSWSFTKENS